jgi:peptide/nickel transport system ATP-binding protein
MTDLLLEMKNIKIEGRSDRQWKPIIKGVDLQLNRGDILGLIGESGAGK